MFGQRREHFRPFLRDCDRVLDVRRRATVERDDSPPVLERLRFVRAHVEHWLDGKDVAGAYADARAGPAVVRDLRVFVHPAPDAVADVVAHDAVAVRLRVLLHGPADVAQIPARPALAYGALQALFGDAYKL